MAGAGYNLARFDLVSIRLAVACVQSGSLTAAAREAHLALAAASRRIRELEGFGWTWKSRCPMPSLRPSGKVVPTSGFSSKARIPRG
ncbi:MAG TPA: LysR family transcriptional regulator [Ramlibacter sp.]